MKETIELNIGLLIEAKGKQWTMEQAKSLVDIYFHNIVSVRYHVGVWDNKPQPTAIVKVRRGDMTSNQIDEAVRKLCTVLEQDSIAYYLPDTDMGKLIYNIRFKDHKYGFDKQYFVRA